MWRLLRGDFIVCEDSLWASMLFTGTVGPSPKKDWGFLDSVLGVVVIRFRWEAMCRKVGEEWRRNGSKIDINK